MKITLTVTDNDSIAELSKHPENEYALGALKVGLLSLRHASVQIDADTVRKEGEKVLDGLAQYAERLSASIGETLESYLDPKSGKFQERIDRLVKKDGELESILSRHVVAANSTIEKTLTTNMSTLPASIRDLLEKERTSFLTEFSLDRKDSALSRLVSALSENSGELQSNLSEHVETMLGEFSLDSDTSALSRLKRELSSMLAAAEAKAQDFRTDVAATLEALKARKEESQRSTSHGMAFEEAVISILRGDAGTDILSPTGTTTGEIRSCKIGDAVLELGPDSAAPGARIVIEAKESSSYDLSKARAEIETGRKNRLASEGIFVFSSKTVSKDFPEFARYGDDIFVTWNSDDVSTNVVLRAAVSLARALCVRKAQDAKVATVDTTTLDATILELEREAARLTSVKTWTETIQSNSIKILDETRKMTDNLYKHISTLREYVTGAK